ncbi:hypothetical protein GCG54_00010238 [Colletotrichum gloeosporioides]|uniref:BTB domain-containing protein n=1 Tax=Colletotrichum gloeosporioides TaxID=474922 RepID=A0A8H4CBZ9_COLGL|nr:uncharacterized protein GCG54_00010238 [Colletotrichum gloeosporioides]KAF3800964.1 hypothetical protein GCG54_00010238 [Colletotrichum gloeosporioides]
MSLINTNRRRSTMESNANSVVDDDANKNESNSDDGNEVPASFGVAAVDLTWLFCSDEKKPMVTIKCGNMETLGVSAFTVLKPILTKHSQFFDKCLRNPCKESESLIIELPEVLPSNMMLYLTLTTRQALMNCASAETLVKREDFTDPNYIANQARFYQLCDFLQNEGLAKSTRKMFVDYLKTQRKVRTESNCPEIFRAYADTFEILKQGHVVQDKLRRVLVKSFCFKINAPNFFKYCDALKEYPDFHFEVAKQYALNSMWNDPVHKTAAVKIKTQRMSIDDESEPEPEE